MANTNFGRGAIKIGTTAVPTDAYECQITNFAVTPSPNTGNISGTYCVGPSIYAQESTFSITLEWLNDFGATPSLSQIMWDNDGTPLYYSFEPDDPTMPSAAGQFYAIAGTFGGPGDDLATSSATLPCVAKPVLTPAT